MNPRVELGIDLGLVLLAFWLGVWMGSVDLCVPGRQRRCGYGGSNGVQYCGTHGLGFYSCHEFKPGEGNTE